MGSNCILHDGKPETCSTEFTTATFIDTIEAFEEVFEMLRFYTNAVVADGELIEMPTLDLYLDAHDIKARCTAGVGNDIVDKVAENTVYQTLVALDLDMLRYLKRWRNALVLELQCGIIEHTVNDLHDINTTVFLPDLRLIVVHFI